LRPRASCHWPGCDGMQLRRSGVFPALFDAAVVRFTPRCRELPCTGVHHTAKPTDPGRGGSPDSGVGSLRHDAHFQDPLKKQTLRGERHLTKSRLVTDVRTATATPAPSKARGGAAVPRGSMATFGGVTEGAPGNFAPRTPFRNPGPPRPRA